MKKWMQDVAFGLHFVVVLRTALLFSGFATMNPLGYMLVLHYGTLFMLAVALLSIVILAAWWVGYRGDWGLTLVSLTFLVNLCVGLGALAMSPIDAWLKVAAAFHVLQVALTMVLSIRWFLVARGRMATAGASPPSPGTTTERREREL